MKNFNQYRGVMGAIALILLAIILYIFFHQVVRYIYTTDKNIAAVIKSFKSKPVVPVQQVVEFEEEQIDEPPIVRGPSCPASPPLLWENLAYEVDSRIAGLSASPATTNLWITRGDGAGGWQRNPNVWTNLGETPINLTGISPWNSASGYQRAGTLISPRHVIMANHFTLEFPGHTIIFVDNDNNVITRQNVDHRRVGTSDISVVLLNEPVPDSIAYYPIIDVADIAGTPENPSTYLKLNNHRVPILMLNQNDRAIVSETNSIRADSTSINKLPPTSPQRIAFNAPLTIGDSGDAILGLINGYPAVLSAHESISFGPNYLYYFDRTDTPGTTDIIEAVQTLTPGFEIEPYDLSCLERNEAPEFSRSSYSFNLNQNYTAGTIVGRVPATDNNTSGDVLSYSLTNTQPGQFSITPNGDIIVLQTGLLDNVSNITLTANVTDDWFSPMTDSANVTITRSNSSNPISRPANDAIQIDLPPPSDTTPPTFSNPVYTFTIGEGLASGSVVGQVSATDTQDPTLTYSISNGNSSGLFSINADTGQIRIANSSTPNYLAPFVFILRVHATDSSNNTTSAIAIVRITDTRRPFITNPQEVEQVEIDGDDGDDGGEENTPEGTPEGGDDNDNGGGGGGGGGGRRGNGDGNSSNPTIPGLPPPPGPGASVQQQISYLQEVIRVLTQYLQTQINQGGSTFSNNTTSISSCGNLTIGSTSPCVQTLQKYLNSHGFIVSASGPGSIGNETNYFGPATAQAVTQFQVAFDIYPASGFFGPLTRAKMAEQP